MTKRYSYRIRIEVEHFSRDEAIRKFEDTVLALRLDKWPAKNQTEGGVYPFPTASVEIAPIVLSVEDRLARIEQEIETRLGGLTEENAA